MTFKKALDTGYRVQHRDWSFLMEANTWWYKKMSDDKCIYSNGDVQNIKDIGNINPKVGWHIHPEDRKLLDFNSKLEKL